MTGLITWALSTLCWATSWLNQQPYRPEKNMIRLERTMSLAQKQLSWSWIEIVETVFSDSYAWVYGIKFSGDYYQETFFLAIDPKTMSYVRVWKNNLSCKKVTW